MAMPSELRSVERAPSAAIAYAPVHACPSSLVIRTSLAVERTSVTRASRTNSTPARSQAARRKRSVSTWRRW
ncbi:hypothetical protein SALBM311S_02470 [Streptomyces alboniger]